MVIVYYAVMDNKSSFFFPGINVMQMGNFAYKLLDMRVWYLPDKRKPH
jgi:hypothetical protein